MDTDKQKIIDEWIKLHDIYVIDVDVPIDKDVCALQASLCYDLAAKETNPWNKFLLSGIANMLYGIEDGSIIVSKSRLNYLNTGRY